MLYHLNLYHQFLNKEISGCKLQEFNYFIRLIIIYAVKSCFKIILENDNIYYITHTNIPVILLVNITSRDIEYYAYIPNIWRERKKFLYKMDISLVFRDIVGCFTDIAKGLLWLCDYRGVCLCLFSPTVTKTFGTNCIKLRILGSNWLMMVTLNIVGQSWWCEHQ